MSPSFGAEVEGVDLSAPLSAAVRQELRLLFDERQMLLFRGQSFSYEQQEGVASIFGPVVADKVSPATDAYFRGLPIDEAGDDVEFIEFHSDYCWLGIPLFGAGVWVEHATPTSAATLFLSCRNAYLTLPAQLGRAWSDLVVEHVIPLPGHDLDSRNRSLSWELETSSIVARHPLLYANPRTGQSVVYYTQMFGRAVVGKSAGESASIFDAVERYLYGNEELVHVHRWQPGDFLVWDNIALQHAREQVHDTPGAPTGRTFRRVAIGDTGFPQTF